MLPPTRAASVFTGPTGWAELRNRLGDWQASSESSRARKSSNFILAILHQLENPQGLRGAHSSARPVRRGTSLASAPSPRYSSQSKSSVAVVSSDFPFRRVHYVGHNGLTSLDSLRPIVQQRPRGSPIDHPGDSWTIFNCVVFSILGRHGERRSWNAASNLSAEP